MFLSSLERRLPGAFTEYVLPHETLVVKPPVIFASADELVSLVSSKIIAPAEEKHQARQQLLDELFP